MKRLLQGLRTAVADGIRSAALFAAFLSHHRALSSQELRLANPSSASIFSTTADGKQQLVHRQDKPRGPHYYHRRGPRQPVQSWPFPPRSRPEELHEQRALRSSSPMPVIG